MRTWLITGASSGLGLDMTRKLLARGDRVTAVVRRPEPMADLLQAHPEQLRVAAADVTDTSALRTAVAEAFQAHGRVDVVVSNAGYGLFGAAEELSDAQIDRQIATNLVAPVQLIRACLPHLREQGGGRIVQVSSEGGQIAYPDFSLYHASKWGVEGFVEAVSKEVAAFGIDFVLVEPGPTATGFRAGLDKAPALPVYEATPAGDLRRNIEGGGFAVKGDAGRTVDAMIRAADADRPPFRLPLGGTAYDNVARTLADRLAGVESQRAEALTADRD